METKQQIRKWHMQMRESLPCEKVSLFSKRISQNLQRFFAGENEPEKFGVYAYYPHKKEVSLLELYAWLLENKIPLAFPRVSGAEMEFYQVDSMEAFCEGAFHIMEPVQSCKKADFLRPFCLVPGIVFDRMGNRYGYGKGYYDRYFLKRDLSYRIGIAYESQVEEWLPAEWCDVKMHTLATENGICIFSKEGEERDGIN